MFLIRPAREGLLIPKPDGTGDLEAKGAVVADLGLYWTRREADGDLNVILVSAETVDGALAEIEARQAERPEKKKG